MIPHIYLVLSCSIGASGASIEAASWRRDQAEILFKHFDVNENGVVSLKEIQTHCEHTSQNIDALFEGGAGRTLADAPYMAGCKRTDDYPVCCGKNWEKWGDKCRDHVDERGRDGFCSNDITETCSEESDCHNEPTDKNGNTCAFYDDVPWNCGQQDHDDFVSVDLCCACAIQCAPGCLPSDLGNGNCDDACKNNDCNNGGKCCDWDRGDCGK